MQKIFTVIIITLNTIGVFFFTGMDFPIFGIALSILSILCSIFFSEYVWMHVFATTVIRSHNIGKYFSKGNAITGAYNISKILLKIYSFIEPVIKWCDTLFEWIIKGEYKILGIEVQGE